MSWMNPLIWGSSSIPLSPDPPSHMLSKFCAMTMRLAGMFETNCENPCLMPAQSVEKKAPGSLRIFAAAASIGAGSTPQNSHAFLKIATAILASDSRAALIVLSAWR